jgi:preprotein translocase subunit SecF
LAILIYRTGFAEGPEQFNWGIDFAGGTELQIKFQETVAISEVREVIGQAGYEKTTVNRFGGEAENEILVRLTQSSEEGHSISSKLMEALTQKYGDKVSLLRVDEVGPKVGRELKWSGAISMLLALLGIMLYVWFRFTPQFAPGAIIALIHDIIITMGVFAFLNLEFDLSDVAALLTIVGYSVNDTIVVYDRIRDNLKRTRRGNLTEVVVNSLNQTLSRTLLTSLTTFIVVLSLFLNTQGGIRNFAFVLMIGIIVGTYSSLFVAAPTLVFLESRKKMG